MDLTEMIGSVRRRRDFARNFRRIVLYEEGPDGCRTRTGQMARAAAAASCRRLAATDASGICLDAETLAAWADGSLNAKELAAAEIHASNCARCMALLAAIERTDTSGVCRVAFERRVCSAGSCRWLRLRRQSRSGLAIPERRSTPVAREESATPAVTVAPPASAPPPTTAPQPARASGCTRRSRNLTCSARTQSARNDSSTRARLGIAAQELRKEAARCCRRIRAGPRARGGTRCTAGLSTGICR